MPVDLEQKSMFVPDKPTLESLIESSIIARIAIIREEGPVTVKLLGVEVGGIWIESQDATDHWLNEIKRDVSMSTFVFFIPYHQLNWVMGFQNRISMSEKSLGVKDQ